jgi:hypothetical protein
MVYGDDMPNRSLLRLPVAAVWLHQGLWCKVLGRAPAHGAVVASLPGLSPAAAHHVTRGLGVAEAALAAVVLARGHRRSVALAQLALVGAMNAGGLLVGGGHIDRPARMVARNAAFAALVWGAVDGR